MFFKNFERKPGRESLKRIIFASDGSRPLQMVSETDTERYVSEEVVLRRG